MIHLLLLAAAAAENTRGLVIPQPVRYEFVYETARVTCRIIEDLAKRGADEDRLVEVFKTTGERLALSDDEQLLLVDFCMLRADVDK